MAGSYTQSDVCRKFLDSGKLADDRVHGGRTAPGCMKINHDEAVFPLLEQSIKLGLGLDICDGRHIVWVGGGRYIRGADVLCNKNKH